MKIILLRDVSGVGQRGTVKDVSDGYALNHLIPNKMAQMATPEALKQHEARSAADKARRAAQENEWKMIAEKVQNFTLIVRANASPQGQLYKKIAPSDIAKLLLEKGIDVPEDAIHTKMPLKHTGISKVDIRLGDKTATLTIEVIAS